MAGSAMKPHLTTSANPAVKSAGGRLSSVDRSHRTPTGGWNAPTRFLPATVFRPVLPPMAASTMPSNDVATGTQRTPRSQQAATKPARSVTAPPPMPTTASVRVNAAPPSASQHRAATSIVLPASASGTSIGRIDAPAARRCTAAASATAASGGACTTATWAAPVTSAGSSPSRSRPTSTGYGRSPPTSMRVVSVTGRSCHSPCFYNRETAVSMSVFAGPEVLPSAMSLTMRTTYLPLAHTWYWVCASPSVYMNAASPSPSTFLVLSLPSMPMTISTTPGVYSSVSMSTSTDSVSDLA